MTEAPHTLDTLVADPLGAVQLLADAAMQTSALSPDGAAPARSVDWGMSSILAKALAADPRGVEAVPLLTSEAYHSGQLQNHTLVRYRGMVSCCSWGSNVVGSAAPALPAIAHHRFRNRRE